MDGHIDELEDSLAKDASEGAEAPNGDASDRPARPKRKKSKKLLVLGVVLGVIVVAAVGMFVWHNDPSFCGTMCHTPMAEYGDTYYAEADAPCVDKWGNEVSNASAMLSVSHREEADATCLSCHVPTLGQQVGEAVATVTGDYYYPLSEVSLKDLLVNSDHESNMNGDQFCLNESCHNITRADLTEMTSDMARNPHAWEHSENPCSDCHKSHRASVMYCTQCHADAEIPDGWVTYAKGEQILQGIYQ